VTLYEATAKKCAFLRQRAERMELPGHHPQCRMEDARQPFDVVTARACAPLPVLLAMPSRFTGPNSVCLF
jgi:16S rRNA G527 N7-methylase RsmG